MEIKAIKIIKDYVLKHLDKSDDIPDFQVYTVWKCRALQNWKFLLSTTLYDGMYYELTFNGDKNEWYLDAYKKIENCHDYYLPVATNEEDMEIIGNIYENPELLNKK